MVVRIIGVIVTAAAAAMLLRMYRPEFAMVLTVAVAAAALLCLLPQIEQIISVFFELSNTAQETSTFALAMVKVVGIAYLAQFAADLCTDCYQSALAYKITRAARIGILTLCLPAVRYVLQIIARILEEAP